MHAVMAVGTGREDGILKRLPALEVQAAGWAFVFVDRHRFHLRSYLMGIYRSKTKAAKRQDSASSAVLPLPRA
jgi:hypothetical protein